ncbi:MAG: HAMP domain-containing histidine kinase [Helicobacteraceae bacterium]|nr:HAMP domain-containing histidine kinase [Helicobacteraceae bacterium]
MIKDRSKTIEALKVIGHQWRQPLNLISMEAINLNVQANLEENVDSKSVLESTKRIEEQVQRMSLVLKSILNLGSEQRYKDLFSINDLFSSIEAAFLDESKKKEVILTIDYLKEDKQIFGFMTDLQEVLLNLINNAKDAYKDKLNGKEKSIFLSASCTDSYYIFVVQDAAGGIPQPIADKVFEQNFSTKITGEGFGIGLYIAKLIIENEFDGVIEFISTQEGTEFRIKIPRNDLSSLKLIK